MHTRLIAVANLHSFRLWSRSLTMMKFVRIAGELRFVELFKGREGNLLFVQHTAMRLIPCVTA